MHYSYNELKDYFSDKKVLILGFGLEGQSTYRLLRKIFPEKKLFIADINTEVIKTKECIDDDNISWNTGNTYLENLETFDVIIKSPGISLKHLPDIRNLNLTSQTEIFCKFFREKIIGITGTKGKSTTSSLIYHILHTFNQNTILLGNIGVPPFEKIDEIYPDTTIVFEMSSHQLQQTNVSPHIAILLNIYEEHLDHYKTLNDYIEAKFRITRFQKSTDYFIYNFDDIRITERLQKENSERNILPYSLNHKLAKGCYYDNDRIIFKNLQNNFIINNTDFNNLPGKHNLMNIMAAVCTSTLCGVPKEIIEQAIHTFKPLEHRIEFVGYFHDVYYYNDSIATIPEACIAALETIKDIDTVILGGYDRGVDYDKFMDYLEKCSAKNLVFYDDAGHRMLEIYTSKKYNSKNTFYYKDFVAAVQTAKKITSKHKVCLLSPAAASYGQFKNYAERGLVFKKLVQDK